MCPSDRKLDSAKNGSQSTAVPSSKKISTQPWKSGVRATEDHLSWSGLFGDPGRRDRGITSKKNHNSAMHTSWTQSPLRNNDKSNLPGATMNILDWATMHDRHDLPEMVTQPASPLHLEHLPQKVTGWPVTNRPQIGGTCQPS